MHIVSSTDFVCAFAPLPDLHNYLSETGAKTTHVERTNKRCYQWAQFTVSSFRRRWCFVIAVETALSLEVELCDLSLIVLQDI